MQNGLKQQNGSTHVETYLQKSAEWTVAANHNGDHDLDDDGNHDDTKADNATLPQQMKIKCDGDSGAGDYFSST